jgi:hypothetical protein
LFNLRSRTKWAIALTILLLTLAFGAFKYVTGIYKIRHEQWIFLLDVQFESLAAGEGVEPSIFGFKARRVASYTIPQKARMKDEG